MANKKFWLGMLVMVFGLVLAGCATGGGGAAVEITAESLQGSWLNSFGTGTSLQFTGSDFAARFGTANFNGTFTLSGNKITFTETNRSGSGSERFKGDMGTGTVSIKGTTLIMKGLPGDWGLFNVKFQKE